MKQQQEQEMKKRMRETALAMTESGTREEAAQSTMAASMLSGFQTRNTAFDGKMDKASSKQTIHMSPPALAPSHKAKSMLMTGIKSNKPLN